MSDIKNIDVLPITFQEVRTTTNHKTINQNTKIEVKIYQSNIQVVESFYRPISKILNIDD